MSELKFLNHIRIRFRDEHEQYFEIEKNVGQASFDGNEKFHLVFKTDDGVAWFMFKEDAARLVEWMKKANE